jgi:hypothetical protein
MTSEILNYWYRALHSPHGIELVCSDVESIRARLYAARREAKDADLDQISICQSPFDPTKLWLFKRPRKDSNDEAP